MSKTKKYGDLQKNVELKKECLKKMKEYDHNSDGYIENTKLIFRKFGIWENELNKDISDFTESEIEDMLYELKISSRGDANRIGSALKKYLLLARGKNLGNLSLDIVNFFKDENLGKYVWSNKREGKVINKEQLDDIVSKTDNPRDKLFTRLCWIGLYGKNFVELSDLKKTDINFEKKIITTNNKIIENVPDEIMNLIEDVIKENEYYSIGINPRTEERSGRVLQLVQSDYILRPIANSRNSENYITKDAFRRLGCQLKKYYKDDYPDISMYNIYRSGMLWSFKEYLKKNNIELESNNRGSVRHVWIKFRNELYPEFHESGYKSFLQDYREYVENAEEIHELVSKSTTHD